MKSKIWNLNDIVVIFIDYQQEMFNGIRSGNAKPIELNTRMLARTAKGLGIPTILSTVGVHAGINKPTITTIREELKDNKEIDRTSMNAWSDKAFVEAVKATGKKKLVFAGLWTEICLTFPVINALGDGYEAMFITDAVGGTSKEAHDMAVLRMIQAGAIPNTALAFATEMNPDWASEKADILREIAIWYQGELNNLG